MTELNQEEIKQGSHLMREIAAFVDKCDDDFDKALNGSKELYDIDIKHMREHLETILKDFDLDTIRHQQ